MGMVGMIGMVGYAILNVPKGQTLEDVNYWLLKNLKGIFVVRYSVFSDLVIYASLKEDLVLIRLTYDVEESGLLDDKFLIPACRESEITPDCMYAYGCEVDNDHVLEWMSKYPGDLISYYVVCRIREKNDLIQNHQRQIDSNERELAMRDAIIEELKMDISQAESQLNVMQDVVEQLELECRALEKQIS